jgi:predicted secreted protein
MAKGAARTCLLKKGGTTIAGVQVTSIAVDSSPIDVTDNDSAGIQALLSESQTRALTMTVSGLESDHILRIIAFTAATSQLITDLTFLFSNALAATDTIAGDFFMTNYKEDMDFKDAIRFSATFTSSGNWTLA